MQLFPTFYLVISYHFFPLFPILVTTVHQLVKKDYIKGGEHEVNELQQSDSAKSFKINGKSAANLSRATIEQCICTAVSKEPNLKDQTESKMNHLCVATD